METTMAENTDDRDARLAFMGLTRESGETLREFWKLIEPELDRILDRFYHHLRGEPKLAAILGEEKRIPQLKNAQTSHWRRLFEGRFDETYFTGVRTIGQVHYRIGLE